jgi:hypothetical protein
MESVEKKTNYFENALFLLLGALCSTVVSIGIFSTTENRNPSSMTSSITTVSESDFDPRVYIGQ